MQISFLSRWIQQNVTAMIVDFRLLINPRTLMFFLTKPNDINAANIWTGLNSMRT